MTHVLAFPVRRGAALVFAGVAVCVLAAWTAPFHLHLVKSLPAEKGRDLLKQVRTHLIETARPLMEKMVHEVTGVKVLSLHHDISTVSGEEVVLFTLERSPLFRETKKK